MTSTGTWWEQTLQINVSFKFLPTNILDASNIAITKSAIYIQIKLPEEKEKKEGEEDDGKTKNGDVFMISTKSAKIEFIVAKRIPKKEFNFDAIHLKKVDTAKLFSSFQV